MSETKTCPKCGAELPANAPSGICPKCLMEAGLKSADESNDAATGSGFERTTPQAGGFVPPSPQTLAPHFPHLEITALLGQGGMGAVYKARQAKLDRIVALKIIRPESADDAAFAERFQREARTLARLSHPNIVGVYDFGEVALSATAGDETAPASLYYFLMEYVDGATLRQLIEGSELQPDQALAIISQICEALQFAHDEAIVHRDIKPENVLVDHRGRVKIADFGLAKLATRSEQDHTLTGTHQVMGTPRYMAPEQMEGSHTVDHRADIYSLGVVFYEMLTGQVPAGHFDPPSQKVEVDVRLDDVVLRSLAREPDRRYQHASEVKTDVESISQSGTGSKTAMSESNTLELERSDSVEAKTANQCGNVKPFLRQGKPQVAVIPTVKPNRKIVAPILLVLLALLCLPVLAALVVVAPWLVWSDPTARPQHPLPQEVIRDSSDSGRLVDEEDIPAIPAVYSVAVLRFVSVGDPTSAKLHAFPHANISEAFCDSLTDAIRRQITHGNTPLLVRPKTTTYQFIVTEQEAVSAGRGLEARAVLMGTLHCEDAQGNILLQDLTGDAELVLTAKLIDVRTGSLLWETVVKDGTPANEQDRQLYLERVVDPIAEAVRLKLQRREGVSLLPNGNAS